MPHPFCKPIRSLALANTRQSKASHSSDTKIATKSKSKTKKPKLYKVIMLNDDYTPMDFVIALMQRIFNKNYDEAVYVTFQVHRYGSAVCGVYTREIAETKVAQVIEIARQAEHPLLCTMEAE